MKNKWLIAGIVLLVLGIVWIAWVLGGVFSHTPGHTRLSELWGAIIFHAVIMGLGLFSISKAIEVRKGAW